MAKETKFGPGITIFINVGSVDMHIRPEDGGPVQKTQRIANGDLKKFSAQVGDRKTTSVTKTLLSGDRKALIYKFGAKGKEIILHLQDKGHFFGSFDQAERSEPGNVDDFFAAI
jgi:hypothetical protein